MRARYLPVILVATVGAAFASQQHEWTFAYKSGTASYVIYGADLGDPIAPSPKDRKISIALEGKVAKDLFDALGPDVKECGSGAGIRIRRKDHIACSRFEKGDYLCHVGFDLRSGKSIDGSIC